MSQPSPQVLQTYTLLQIAAEAFMGRLPNAPAALPGETMKPVLSGNETLLKDGNGHSSRMTDQQAIDFATDWDVISHQPNTATGFSATLFKLKPGRADAGKGTYENQLVVSFRSTEFIEDHVRDNQTNALEVKQAGWAFGQIADMQAWWASVQSQVGAAQVDVTGYSLGGHLAAAFSLLHPDQVGQVFTFNGAGVGRVKQGDLASVIAGFAQRREAERNAGLFSDPVALAEYQRLVPLFRADSDVDAASAEQALTAVRTLLSTAQLELISGAATLSRIEELELLAEAMSRIASLAQLAQDVPTKSSGGEQPGNPASIQGASNIAALRLDYQLASLQARRYTEPGPTLGYIFSESGPRLGGGRPGHYDVYGLPRPSAVANSQYHLGAATGGCIENQPLLRRNWPAQRASGSRRKISTRRFFARPVSLPLSATGSRLPRPAVLMRAAATPRSLRKLRTVSARCWDSGSLIASEPVESV